MGRCMKSWFDEVGERGWGLYKEESKEDGISLLLNNVAKLERVFFM